MRSNCESYAAEEVNDTVRVTEIGCLAVAEEEEFVEHVKNLGGRLVNSDNDCFPFFLSIAFEAAHERVGGM